MLSQVVQVAGSIKMRVHRVLVVDDEFLIRAALVDHLTDHGFEVLQAENADQALALIRKDDRIDLVLTDVCMPGKMDGIALARWVSTHRPGIALIVASSESAKLIAVSELSLGETLKKPYEFDKTIQRIFQTIERHRPAHQLI